MTTELRDKVVRLEAKMETIESVPTRIVRLEAGFSNMKSTLEDIRLQGMEASRREDVHYTKISKTIEDNHSKVMARIGNVEDKQKTIYTSFNVAFFCCALLVGGVYLWANVLSPSLSTRIVHDSRGPLTTSRVVVPPAPLPPRQLMEPKKQ